MVERLKHAIEKARAQRIAEEGEAPAAARTPAAARRPASAARSDAWAALRAAEANSGWFARSRVVTREKSDPSHIAFDLLRTRLLKVLRDNGWRRIAITSPTKGCGKTLISANLAFSLARQPEIRTLLVDLDLKAPAVSRTLGLRESPPIAWFLNGSAVLENAAVRYGENLAVIANGERVRDSAELIQSDGAEQSLASAIDALKPDVVIYDLPPLMVSDDATASLEHVDCVLLVAAAGQTTARQIEECERLMVGHTHFLGVMLNKARDNIKQYGYEYGYS